MWNERFGEVDYAYGKQANDFLRENVSALPKGRILSLAEGEGRNAVFLAEQGYQVTGVDSSSVGLEKARKLAKERKVSIDTICADLSDFSIEKESYDGVVSIFCHLPKLLRETVYERVVAGLRPGGVFLIEAYRPAQLERDTGGPKAIELLLDAETLKASFPGFRCELLREVDREIVEGKYHTGMASVVQGIFVKA